VTIKGQSENGSADEMPDHVIGLASVSNSNMYDQVFANDAPLSAASIYTSISDKRLRLKA
jgi:hypothetical protein